MFDTGVEDLPVGSTLEMTAHAEGYDPVKIDPVVALPIGEHPPRTAFRLPPATVFVGRVVAADGRPIGAAAVQFLSKEYFDDSGQGPNAVTNETGVFTISGLGSWDRQSVFVSAAGYGLKICAMADLLEAPGWLTDIVLEPTATVEGRGADARGIGVVNAHVRALLRIERSSGESWRLPELGPSTRTDENGYYQLSGLPAGRVSIWMMTEEPLRTREQPVDLTSGATTTLDFIDDSGP